MKSYRALIEGLAALVLLAGAAAGGCSEDTLLVLEGEEDTSPALHLVALGVQPPSGSLTSDIQSRLDDIHSAGGFGIIAHPDRYGFTGPTELSSFKGYGGLELFPDTDRGEWDAVLTAKIAAGEPPVWGFMSDDFHYLSSAEHRFIMLRAPELTKEAVFNSLRLGSFYWGTAFIIKDISREGGTIAVTLESEASIKFITSRGRIVGEVTGTYAAYDIRGDEGYVRVEVAADGKVAGSQPFVVGEPGSPLANPYAAPGRWYKGNLHAHTTASDGWLSREEVEDTYRKDGYSFLAITDHIAWDVPVESEAYIQGKLTYTGSAGTDKYVTVGAALHGASAFVAAATFKLNGPGEYAYVIPFVPQGEYVVSAAVTASGYPAPLNPGDLLARGEYRSPVKVSLKQQVAGIDFTAADVTPPLQ